MPVHSHRDGSTGEHTTIGDLMPDEHAEIPGDNGVTDSRYDYLEEAMSELDDMSKDIVMSQILRADKVKLSDLGDKYGITGERVRQIKKKALDQLKQKIVYRMRINGQEPTATAEPPKIAKKRGRPKKIK
jgi:DNA-directed RNA polymerase sigma subunit (sigma70/sigma32)